MNDRLLALVAKHQLRITWENPNDTAPELMEPDDTEPSTLVIESEDGTVWSTDYEESEQGRLTALQQFLLEADDVFEDVDPGLSSIMDEDPEEHADAEDGKDFILDEEDEE